MNHINSYLYVHGLSSLKMMKQQTGVIPLSFWMYRGNPLIEPYNEIIGRLRDAGITEYWINFDRKKSEKIDDLGPQILDMNHLEVCFYVCMFPLIFAFLAFFGELSVKPIKNILTKLREKLRDGISTCRLRLFSRNDARNRIIQVRPIGSGLCSVPRNLGRTVTEADWN
jgi:hypothetical protein